MEGGRQACIINNTFTDASTGEVFQSNLRQSATTSRWWGGEPIWVTAVKHGRKSAAAFWAGSEAEIKGIRLSGNRAKRGRGLYLYGDKALMRTSSKVWIKNRIPAADIYIHP